MYPSRVKLLERLIAKGIPVRVYGSASRAGSVKRRLRTAYAGYPVLGAEKARVYRSAGAVLNTMNLQEIAGVNGRLFARAGSGAAVLTEFRPALPDLFDIGARLLTYRNFDEPVDQATRVLTDPGLAGRLGDAAARRAHRDHIYERRLQIILEKVA